MAVSSRYYNKEELKQQLELEQIYDLIEAWGGEPEYTDKGLVSQTICHNKPGVGSRKLYYYENTRLFSCYTHCDDRFDIFELYIKVRKIQYNQEQELYDAMDYIASYFGINGVEAPDNDKQELEDWQVFKRHELRPAGMSREVSLPEYDKSILTMFAYPRIAGWEREGISAETARRNYIGYYPGGEQITIPHFDINGRLIGIRGRALAADEADRYGKYRPLLIGKQLYNHPLSMNLYNLNNSKENLRRARVAVVFESEKSCLMYQSHYGPENDISVAVCGSSLSTHQVNMLKDLGVNELIIAFDRQFQEIGDDEFKRLKTKLIHFYNKYNTSIKITAIFDKHMLLPYKASPIDEGPRIFERLMKERIVPYEP